MRDVGALFFNRGWSVGTSSNYSVVVQQDPLQLLITASGKDKGHLATDDFVRVDGAGRPVDPEGPQSSAETMLHVVLARNTHAGSVLHTHSVWGTLLSDLYHSDGGFHIEGYEMLKGLSGITTHQVNQWVEIFDNSQDIPALAEQVGRRLTDDVRPVRHGFLIRKHGLYTWGKDLDEARRHVEIFEFLFEVVARRLALTGAIPTGALDYS